MNLKSNEQVKLRMFVWTFMPFFILASVVAYLFLYMDHRNRVQAIKSNTENRVALQVRTINLTFHNVVTDILHLADLNELKQILDTPTIEDKAALAREYLSFSRQKGIYDQIRFLDSRGMEVVRVNYNSGNSSVVPEIKLQNKGQRYYFKDTFQQTKGDIFVSPFDLNIEKGQIEQPIKPMIRFGTPVFDKTGNKRGVVLLNYLGAQLIELFKSVATDVPGKMFLLNRDGYWLASPDSAQEWGFMYEDGKNRVLGTQYAKGWDRIASSEAGQFQTDNGLFTFASVFPLSKVLRSSSGSGQAFASITEKLGYKDYYWKVVSFVPLNNPFLKATEMRKWFFMFYSIVVILIVLWAWLLSQSRMKVRMGIDALNNKITELEETRNELVQSEKMASLGRMVAGFAHEINTPIGIAVGAVSHAASSTEGIVRLLDQDEVHEEDLESGLKTVKESTGLALSSLQRTAELIGSFKRTSVDQVSEQERTFNVHELVQDVINSLHNKFRNNKVSFKVDCPIEFNLHGIPGIYAQILTNLIMNSHVHGFDNGSINGRIDIAVRITPENRMLIDYTDNGKGMDSQAQVKVFEPFFTTNRSHGGSGLGLYIVYNLVTAQLAGTIKCESSPGEGTKFRIEHPI